jgi:hypothetical protein
MTHYFQQGVFIGLLIAFHQRADVIPSTGRRNVNNRQILPAGRPRPSVAGPQQTIGLRKLCFLLGVCEPASE